MGLSSLSAQDALKLQAAQKALEYIPKGCVLGVGTGSTVNFLIDLLPQLQLQAAVASSKQTEQRLKAVGIEVAELNHVNGLDLYVDGADEINDQLMMIKGGGGALTREKIIAASAGQFICMVDASKCVPILGRAFPLPVEVIPMARSAVARQLAALGGQPAWREGVVTDNGNLILDVHGLDIQDAFALESTINNIPGVVCHGLFARQAAHTAIVASGSGIAVKRR